MKTEVLTTASGTFHYYPLAAAVDSDQLAKLPFSLRVLLENALRFADSDEDAAGSIASILNWQPQQADRPAVVFRPARVLLQDLTGVPVVVDLAAMRSALARMGGDPSRISPVIPVDLVIDHSVQVDYASGDNPMALNVAKEYERNQERYALLRWAQSAFDNFRVVPPGKGICHQVNLEKLAPVVATKEVNGKVFAYPDSVFGTDSHTPMINGLGVAGWGVGGIEAISAMLGKSVDLVLPDVIGLEFTGSLPHGVTPTDLTLSIVELLRKQGVVGKFIECCGAGLDALSLPDRAMIANMTPETGATMIYFPVDAISLDYMRFTGREEAQVALTEAYCKAQGLYRESTQPLPLFTQLIQFDLTKVEPSLAGPTRPQDRMAMRDAKTAFEQSLARAKTARGFDVPAEERANSAMIDINGETVRLKHGSLLIAAITSCTNTSNPTVLLSAGLLARNALKAGLKTAPQVKTSLMPGSRVVTAYLKKTGLLEPLAGMGFVLTGYGCGSCIGNSGPLPEAIVNAVQEHHLVTASISSANRNFEGRIHPTTRANFLASPPLVVAYAIAGRMDIDLTVEPLGVGADGKDVYLSDIFPAKDEVEALFAAITPELFAENYADLFEGDARWQTIGGETSPLYAWDAHSTYIQEPPYFAALERGEQAELADIRGARVLALLGDSITTDHISPAGNISSKSEAGQYLQSKGIGTADFNSYGARRGNDRVMTRGTFANIRLKNLLLPGVEGSLTRYLPSGEQMSIYAAAMRYQQENVPLLVLAGKEYGSGSSRDWAAKGPLLLGVKAVIAESFERIHRSNLVGMGVLPLEFLPGENAHSLGLSGEEVFAINGLDALMPRQILTVLAAGADGMRREFQVRVRIDTSTELAMFRAGGILHLALLEMR